MKPHPDQMSGMDIQATRFNPDPRQNPTNPDIQALKLAVEADPEDAEAHFNLGLAYHANNMLNEAIVEYNEAIDNGSDNESEVQYYLGVAYKALGQYDEGIEAFDEAVNDENLQYKAYYQLGLLYMSRNQYDKAVKNLKDAVGIDYDEIDKDDADAFIALGNALKLSTGNKNATESYKERIKMMI